MKKWWPIIVVAIIVVVVFVLIEGNHQEDAQAALAQEEQDVQMADETFTTYEGDVPVDYSDYKTVIIPRHDSVNEDVLGHQNFTFDGPYINQLKFLVFGELMDVVMTYNINMNEQGGRFELGTIKDTVVFVDANLPNDVSAVIIEGKVVDSQGQVHEVRFVLDGVSDLPSYDIYLYK